MAILGDTPMSAQVAINFIRTRVPGVSDDATQGYAVGAHWTDTTSQKTYVCTRNTAGTATWTEVTGGTTTPPPTEVYPASYFTGPLGLRNVVPNDPAGAIVVMWTGVTGFTSQQQRNMHLQRMTDAGRNWDGIQFQGTGLDISGQTGEDWINSLGILPCHVWNPGQSIQNIVNGLANAAIDAEIARLGHKSYRVMIRLMHEFNGSNTPYYHQNNPTLWKQAWQYIVQRFKNAGSTNVGFWWCPQEQAGNPERSTIDACYPGDAYVDWVGSDEYNHSSQSAWSTPLHAGWTEFDEMNNYDFYGFNTNPSMCNRWGPIKPFVTGETGSRYDPANVNRKANWHRNIDVVAKAHLPNLRGIAFFDVDTGSQEWNNWRVDVAQSDAQYLAQNLGTVDAVTYQGFKDLVNVARWKGGIRP